MQEFLYAAQWIGVAPATGVNAPDSRTKIMSRRGLKEFTVRQSDIGQLLRCCRRLTAYQKRAARVILRRVLEVLDGVGGGDGRRVRARFMRFVVGALRRMGDDLDFKCRIVNSW